MKIDIYLYNDTYCVCFNEKEYTFVKGGIDMIHVAAYRWLTKQQNMWKPKSPKEVIDVLTTYPLVATIYVTAVKDIPAALEAYPELLL